MVFGRLLLPGPVRDHLFRGPADELQRPVVPAQLGKAAQDQSLEMLGHANGAPLDSDPFQADIDLPTRDERPGQVELPAQFLGVLPRDDQAQAILAVEAGLRASQTMTRHDNESILRGLLFAPNGDRMLPTATKKKSRH